MSWKDLDIKLRAELIKLGVLSGIRDINLIRLLYDDNNTPTLVVDLFYNETNVRPLLGIERIKLEYDTPEEEVNKANEIIQLIENEISLEEINNQLPILFRLFSKGGLISNNPTLSYSGGGPIRRKRENSLSWRMAAYNAIDPRTTVKNIENAFRLYNAAVAKEKSGETSKDYTLDNTIGDLTADAAWRKRLLLPYDETLLPVWNGDTVSLSKPLELEIPIDTNLVKDRINYAQNEFWNDVKSLNLRQLKEDLAYKKSQEELLDALRYTYKTGKPIGVSEYHANSIDPEKVLKDFKYGISPLNVLGRYNIRYDKDENKMYYSDEWDFNQYEWAVPGTTFRIRGAIPLNSKNEGKVKKYSKGGYENPDEPPVSESTYVLQPPLNILELELLNYLLSNPTAEQEYFRNLAIQNMTAPQSNLGVALTKEEQDLVDKAILGYNNFRYSHPWAEGLSYTPIIGDGMDLISLAGDINNKNYINAGLDLGMIALPNFIQKPIQKYKIDKIKKEALKPWNSRKDYLKGIRHLSKDSRDILEKIVIPRMSSRYDISKINNDINNQLIYIYDNDIYDIAGGKNVAASYDLDAGLIYMRNDDYYNKKDARKKTYDETHEARHSLDQKYPLTKVLKDILLKAYDHNWDDMIRVYNFKNSDYPIDLERVTTNNDLRELLFDRIDKYNEKNKGAISVYDLPIEKLNLIIDKLNEDFILDALSDVNGYGNKYRNLIWDSDTPQETYVKNIKNALKYVPSTIPLGLLSYLLRKQKDLNQYKLGGFLFPNLVFSHKFEK